MIRLIGPDSEQLGVVSIQEALKKAQEAELDLVEIAPTADPPVCRIMDFGKYQFTQTKKKKTQKARSEIKELKFRPGIGQNDYQVKLNSLLRFLEQGHKVKVTLRFRGREIAHHELGIQLLERLKLDLANQCVVEQEPKFEGRQIVMVVAPKSSKATT